GARVGFRLVRLAIDRVAINGRIHPVLARDADDRSRRAQRMYAPIERIAENGAADAEADERADEKSDLVPGLDSGEEQIEHRRPPLRPSLYRPHDYRSVNP